MSAANFIDDVKVFIENTCNTNCKFCESSDNFFSIFVSEKNIEFVLVPLPVGDFNESQKYFFQKKSLHAISKNKKCIVIWEDIWVKYNNIVKHRIEVLLGKFTRIHARKCNIERIDKKTLDNFLLANNMYGSPTAKFKYALIYDERIVAVASFSAGRPIERNGEIYRSYELVRFANLNGYVVTGGLGKLLSHFISNHNPDDIMSYADLDWASGAGYKKLGFDLIEATEPLKLYLDTKTKQRYYEHTLPVQIQKEYAAQSLPLLDFLASKSIFGIYNSGNLKFLLKLKHKSDGKKSE